MGYTRASGSGIAIRDNPQLAITETMDVVKSATGGAYRR
jgi:hypothetical protein